MKKYKALDIVCLYTGNLELTDEQAEARRSMVSKSLLGYEIVAPVYFKAGEVFKYDGVVSKGMGVEELKQRGRKRIAKK